MPLTPDSPALRRISLAVTVLYDLELDPWSDGIVLRGGRPVEVSWHELHAAVGGADLESRTARLRVLRHLRGRRIAADTPPAELAAAARPLGYPVGHPYHPGAGWVIERVAGGALDLGLGFVGMGEDPDEVVLVPSAGLDAAGIDPTVWWGEARSYLERMGRLSAERVLWEPRGALRVLGDCDVVTLLGSRLLRVGLCERDDAGMAAAAVPMRRRGWLNLARMDPAFAAAAAAATDEHERGFDRALLLTPDEVSLAVAGGRPAELPLRDPATPAPVYRDVRWR